MNKRGGQPVKLVLIAAGLLCGIYCVYLYSSTLTRLKEAETSAEKYRRSDESKISQLHDAAKEKNIIQDKCASDRTEFVNRYNSLNSQHKMLKGQQSELEAENGRIQDILQKAKDDHANIEAQRSQDFSQMKQEKDLEIEKFRNELADIRRENERLQNEISSLKSELENSKKTAVEASEALNQMHFQQERQQRAVQAQDPQLSQGNNEGHAQAPGVNNMEQNAKNFQMNAGNVAQPNRVQDEANLQRQAQLRFEEDAQVKMEHGLEQQPGALNQGDGVLQGLDAADVPRKDSNQAEEVLMQAQAPRDENKYRGDSQIGNVMQAAAPNQLDVNKESV